MLVVHHYHYASTRDTAEFSKLGDNSEDLDLHVIQVDKKGENLTVNRATCETFFNNRNGCKDTSLYHNMKQGAESLLISYSVMIF